MGKILRPRNRGVYVIRLHRWVCDACYKEAGRQETCPGPWHKSYTKPSPETSPSDTANLSDPEEAS